MDVLAATGDQLTLVSREGIPVKAGRAVRRDPILRHIPLLFYTSYLLARKATGD
jgi:hypothetical protein